MDKLKPYLDGFKKYHFWVLCVVILGAAFFAWRSGTTSLAQLTESNTSQIRGAFSQAEGVNRHQPHPNQTFIKATEEARKKLLAELRSAWQLHFDRQKEVLVWPSSPLRDDFAAKVSALGPDEEIPFDLRFNFQNQAKKIPAGWVAKYNLRHELPGAGDKSKPQLEGVLIWNEVPTLEQRYSFPNKEPETKQIRIAQEDFWMYETVLQGVARMNEGRTQHHEALVKQIVTLQIAQNALLAPTIEVPNAGPAGGLNEDAVKQVSVPAADAGDAELVANRYCDASGRPLPMPTGREEFKLMPVRLVVIMDQRKVPDLLVSLANTPLLFDPTLVLYSADVSVEAAKATGGGKNKGGAALEAERGQYDAQIEIRGFMYLFNPPDAELFRELESATQGPDVAAAK